MDPATIAKAKADVAAKLAAYSKQGYDKWDKIYNERKAAAAAEDIRRHASDNEVSSIFAGAGNSTNPLSAWNPRKEPRPKKKGPLHDDSSSDDVKTPIHHSDSEEREGSRSRRDTAPLSRKATTATPKAKAAGDTAKKSIRTPVSAGVKRPAPPPSPARQRADFFKVQNRGPQASSSNTRQPATPAMSAMASDQTGLQRQPPQWYTKFSTATMKKRNPNLVNAETLLDRLKGEIVKAKTAFPSPLSNAALLTTRELLHTLVFQEVDKAQLRSRRLLHNADGLPQIFDATYSGGVVWPYDIKADAEELYNKWCTGQFETDLLRGIDRGKPSKAKDKAQSEGNRVDKLAANTHEYRLINVKTHGNGKLLNGAWWPTQLAAMRDGAHGQTIAGIDGEKGQGVYSLVMAGGMDPSGQPYPNVDNGDTVFYCGTDSTDGTPSHGTQSLLESVNLPNPVRLIRSSKLNNQYAPELGFRYDGLYDIVGVEKMDEEKSARQRHRFKLVRVANQDPIRGSGPEKRPTSQEVAAYKRDESLRGY